VPLLPLFVDSQYEMRSGWKFLAYSVLIVFLFWVTGNVVGMLAVSIDPSLVFLSPGDVRFLGLNAIVLFIPSSLALLVMARFVDRVPISVFGVTVHKGWLRDFGMGLALAGGMLALTLAGAFIFGKATVVEWSASGSALPAVGLTLAVLALGALNEELVFRGYPFQIFLKGIGPWGAMLLISSIFGLLHLNNEGATVVSTLNTVLAGVLLCLAYLKTRSPWLPYGIHFGWNVGLAVVLGYPVSGIATASILKTRVFGSEAILGGSYGPEDGLLGTVIFLAGAIAINRLPVGRVSPEMQATLAAHAGKVYNKVS
jgi:membrane protease YdiL (CAAX protease family)